MEASTGEITECWLLNAASRQFIVQTIWKPWFLDCTAKPSGYRKQYSWNTQFYQRRKRVNSYTNIHLI